jgi:hypothetical protein
MPSLRVLVIVALIGASVGSAPDAVRAQPDGRGSPPGVIQCVQIPTPSPNGVQNYLLGIAAISPKDMWAVGWGYSIADGTSPLVEHWDGALWAVVPTPTLSGAKLYAATAVNSVDVWAVGQYGPNDATQPFTMHWDGQSWTIVRAPRSPDGRLNGVTAISTDDVWAVGFGNALPDPLPMAMHWDGTSWTLTYPTSSLGSLWAVDAVTFQDVWAVGYQAHGFDNDPISFHWDGTQWTSVAMPSVGGDNRMEAVAAVSSTNVWAVGFTSNGDRSKYRALAEQWNGSTWSIIKAAGIPGLSNTLFGAAVVGSTIWAAGYGENPTSGAAQTLLERQTARGWRITATPNPGDISILNAVAAPSREEIWTVGNYWDLEDGIPLTLAIRCTS